MKDSSVISFPDDGSKFMHLKDIRAYKEKDKCYLDLTYEYEDDTKKETYSIPKVRLPIENARIETLQRSSYHEGSFMITRSADYVLQCGSVGPCLNICSFDKEGKEKFTVNIEKKEPVEMSLSEIEKIIGHKVKIVNK